MKRENVFSHLDKVEELLQQVPFGLLTDVDGVMSEIAPTPAEARVSPRCRRALKRLVKSVAVVAAVSGRPAGETRAMVGVGGAVCLGNHGLEWVDQKGESGVNPKARDYGLQIHSALEELTGVINLPGIIVEDKGLTASIHYRRTLRPTEARGLILKAIRSAPSTRGLVITEGRRVVEIRPPIPANKGTAVEWLAETYGLKSGLYLGDDLTDVDAFAALHRLNRNGRFQGLALAVVGVETSPEVLRHADYVLNGVPEVERFLEWLADSAKPEIGLNQ